MPPIDDDDRAEWHRLCKKWSKSCFALLRKYGLEHRLSTLGIFPARANPTWPSAVQHEGLRGVIGGEAGIERFLDGEADRDGRPLSPRGRVALGLDLALARHPEDCSWGA
jgi:hypothetical protein